MGYSPVGRQITMISSTGEAQKHAKVFVNYKLYLLGLVWVHTDQMDDTTRWIQGCVHCQGYGLVVGMNGQLVQLVRRLCSVQMVITAARLHVKLAHKVLNGKVSLHKAATLEDNVPLCHIALFDRVNQIES